MKMGFALLGDMTVSPYFAGPRMLKKEIRTYQNKIPQHGTRSEGFQKRHLHEENKEMNKVNERPGFASRFLTITQNTKRNRTLWVEKLCLNHL
jgi:hypothetical protein